MDIATIIGIVSAFTLILLAMGDVTAFIDIPSVLIVIGGTIAATLIANPLGEVVGLIGVYLKAIRNTATIPTELIEKIVGFAETARREGILALEHEVKPKDDPFLSQGVRLAVDGTEPDLIMDILETELQFIEERHRRGQRIVQFLGRSCLIFGGLGAVMVVATQPGVAGMEVLARAVLPLGYGLFIFGFLGEPVTRKLRTYTEMELLAKKMIIEGIMAIQQGDNPRIVEHKLSVFLSPALRPAAPEEPEPAPSPAAPPPVDEDFVAEVRTYGSSQQDRIVNAVRELAQESDAPAEEKARVEEMLERVDRKELPAMTLMALMSKELRNQVTQALVAPAPSLVHPELARHVVVFEDLTRLTDREIQVLMREVDQKDLVVALKGAPQELRDRFLSNLSERVRTFIQEEISYLGPLHAVEVFEVQTRIVVQFMQLAEQGKVTLCS